MRELRFRAWRTNSKFTINLSGLEIEAYTGLKDKNGAPIFEGDIVRFRNLVRQEIGKIEFRDGFFGIRYLSGYERLCLLSRFDCEGNIEIIGNTHETPELINQEDKP